MVRSSIIQEDLQKIVSKKKYIIRGGEQAQLFG